MIRVDGWYIFGHHKIIPFVPAGRHDVSVWVVIQHMASCGARLSGVIYRSILISSQTIYTAAVITLERIAGR